PAWRETVGAMFSFDARAVSLDADYQAVMASFRRSLAEEGVEYAPLDKFLTDEQASLKTWFTLADFATIGADPFVQLNAALWQGGTFVRLPNGVACNTLLQAFRTPESIPFDRQLVHVGEAGSLDYVSGCVSEAMP